MSGFRYFLRGLPVLQIGCKAFRSKRLKTEDIIESEDRGGA